MTDPDEVKEVSPNEFTEHPEGKVVGETEQTVAAEPVDLTGSQEEVKDEAVVEVVETIIEENTVDPDAGTQDDPANDHRLSTVKPEKVYPVEVPIEYLLNMNTGNVFPVNEDIVRQKGLVPCTKDGKVLPDHRRPSDFR